MPFLLSLRFIVIFKGKKSHHATGTISQGGNQMHQVSRDSPPWPYLSTAVIFYPFPALFLTACWVKPEGIMPPFTLVLLETQMTQPQLAAHYHPGVSRSLLLKLLPTALPPSSVPTSLKNNQGHSTWPNKTSLFITLKCIFIIYPFFKGRNVPFLFQVSVCACESFLGHCSINYQSSRLIHFPFSSFWHLSCLEKCPNFP